MALRAGGSGELRGNARWGHAAEWALSVPGAWWLRRSLSTPSELQHLMDPDLANEALKGFSAEEWVCSMAGPLPDEPELALAQIESTAYMRNQLLRDSDWASMDHSVELRTPLVDAHLLQALKPVLTQFKRFPNKRLLSGAPQRPMPAELARRKKTGFGIPVQQWMRAADPSCSPQRPKLSGWAAWAFHVVQAYDAEAGVSP